jgi:glycosyltransferase involved in cell wall biosynthesis
MNAIVVSPQDFAAEKTGGRPLPPREKLTVIIPAFNEETNIAACMDSVAWADEVFVVDSFSTDKTPEIAAARGARLVQHEYVNSATQKNWAIPQATHSWVMIVDADERVTPELRDEILRELESPSADGYDIRRENYFMGKRVRFCGWQSDTCLRLFRRDKSRYQDRQVHADVIVDGAVGKLQGKLIHETFRSFDQYMKKFDRYTTWAAGDRAKRTQSVGFAHLGLRPAGRFLKQYVLKLGFLDGKTGLIICSLAAYSVFMKYAKLWEMRERESRNGKGPAT